MDSYKDELRHHGILGMHWGIRRYQNKDGTLTSAGKKRYGKEKTETTSEKNSNDNSKAMISKMDDIAKNTLSFGAGYGYFKNRYSDPSFKERADRAADLGLKALKKQGRLGIEEIDVGDPDSRWWFLYEDQTIGLGMVADLINQGRTAAEVSNIVDFIEKNAHDYNKAKYAGEKIKESTNNLVFEVSYGNYNDSLKTFAKVCEEIKKQESNNLKHSDVIAFIDSYEDELYHHGIKGQKWGVRRYQNPDGSLTSEGIKRYSSGNINRMKKEAAKLRNKGDDSAASKLERDANNIEKERDRIDKRFANEQLQKALSEHKAEYREMIRQMPPTDKARMRAGRAAGWLSFASAMSGVGLPITLALTPVSIFGDISANDARKMVDTEFANKYVKDLKTPTGRSLSFVERKFRLGEAPKGGMAQPVFTEPKKKR